MAFEANTLVQGDGCYLIITLGSMLLIVTSIIKRLVLGYAGKLHFLIISLCYKAKNHSGLRRQEAMVAKVMGYVPHLPCTTIS